MFLFFLLFFYFCLFFTICSLLTFSFFLGSLTLPVLQFRYVYFYFCFHLLHFVPFLLRTLALDILFDFRLLLGFFFLFVGSSLRLRISLDFFFVVSLRLLDILYFFV